MKTKQAREHFIKCIGFILIALFIFAGQNLFSQINVQLLKIRILENEAVVNIGSRGEHYLSSAGSDVKYSLKNNRNYVVKAEGDNIIFSGREFPSPLAVKSMNEDSFIEVNNDSYRGAIVLSAVEGKISVINEIDVELYLYGVLPKEVIASWPEESLKAQAVISRTYALRNLGHHTKEGFDLCDTTHCQVYGGKEGENARTNKAVDETRGEVLFYEGKLASTFFHGSCGGYTENIENVWGSKAPAYLKGRSVKYANPRSKDYWKNKIGSEFIREQLNKAGYNTGKIDKIKMSGRSASGRTKDLKIYGEKKTVEISAAKFRLMIDPWKVRSTLFEDITKSGDSFVFEGLGWGHGVGLCQESAKNMAAKGFSYEKILKYFYPGTYLAKWDEQDF